MQVNGAAGPMVAGNNAQTANNTLTGKNITSNDFMTLLVTEMKNQDPTQPTDPSAYLQQLVSVNSLQQLIQINSGINSLTAGK